MTQPLCATCKFWSHLYTTFGVCCRYPPQLLKMNGKVEAYLPEMESDDWCGEHQPKAESEDGNDKQNDAIELQ